MTIPRTLGRYEVVDLIGRGGMGVLYRARDPRIGRYVAIKQLRPEFDTPELRDRFSREAAAAGSLSHPNIVTIYDVGEADGLPFIAMEYVRGETFTDVLGLRPPLSVQRKLQLVEEVCAGLAYAHEAGVVHRDIKPANLIVGSEGIVKILDFGIAKLNASGITLPGVILGTLNYMAPEQVRGDVVDARADVFAVGAVLYELLTHRQAFPGRTSNEILDRILNGTPRPMTEACPDIDPRLVDLVRFALEKDPDQRIQEIASFQKELANIRLRPAVDGTHRSTTRRAGSKQRKTGLMTPPPAPVSGRRSAVPSDRDLPARRAQVDEHLIAAEREFEAGNYDAAIESCKQVLMLDDSNERAIAQLDRIHAAFDEQQALADIAAGEQEAEAALRAGIDDARRRFAEGEHQAALGLLEALASSGLTDVTQTLAELQAALRQIEEQRRLNRERAERRQRLADASVDLTEVNTYLSMAERALETSDLGAALDWCKQALALDASNLRAIEQLHRIDTALNEERAQPAPVRLGISAPVNTDAGETFSVRFVAYAQNQERAVRQRLRALDPALSPAQRHVTTGLTPSREPRWRVGTPVTVRVSGQHLRAAPSSQSFEWNGTENLLSFLVTVEANAPKAETQLCFEAFIEGVPIFFLPVGLHLGRSGVGSDLQFRDGVPAATAFASYSSKDDALVKQCLSALKHWDPSLEVFMDCLDLTPNAIWQHELERVIPSKDSFLLFWSVNAMKSEWVAWEVGIAESARGVNYIRPIPLDGPDVAPPPAQLQHLHFGDRYLAARKNNR